MLASTRAKWFWAGLVVIVVGLGGLIATWQPAKAEAHPLGNFTINRYSRIELSPSGVHLRYVVDMAEIPTFQEHAAIDQDGNGRIDEAERSAYLQQKADTLRQGVALKISDSTVELRAVSSELSFPPGQGGLDTERIVINYAAPMPSGWQSSAQDVEYRDKNYEERIGWREIVAVPLDGVRLANSSVPSTDVSDELRAYPKDAIANPLNVSRASFEFTSTPAGSTSSITAAVPATHFSNQVRAIQGNPDSPLARYAQLIAKDRLSVGVIIIALLAAIGFGAVHALSPGHGKTIVGAYLVGSRGTWRHALLLSLTVTVTHTSSVYALGFVTLYLSAFIVPEKLYPWLSIASGGLILAMGLTLLVSRLRTSRLLGDAWVWLKRGLPVVAGPQLALEVAGAGHAHADHGVLHTLVAEKEMQAAPPMHSHGSGPAHSHTVPGQEGRGLTLRSLIGLGIFGGLLPCPSAIVVMLSAIALHRVAFGLILIVAFSFGLAAVLTTIGLLLVYAGTISRRLPFASAVSSRLGTHAGLAAFAVRAFPVASAAAVLVAGLVLTAHGLSQQGLL